LLLGEVTVAGNPLPPNFQEWDSRGKGGKDADDQKRDRGLLNRQELWDDCAAFEIPGSQKKKMVPRGEKSKEAIARRIATKN